MTARKGWTATKALHLAERLGVIARPLRGDYREMWGILNPGGCTARDGTYYLFPRMIAEGNYSRIGIARLVCNERNTPTGIDRLGIALEPQEAYEFNALGGGVEDPRITYVSAIDSFIMAYTAYAPFTSRIALASSPDLLHWKRLGLLRFSSEGDVDLNNVGNKDCVVLPEIVNDPTGEPCIALLHRPTTSIEICDCECRVAYPPSGRESKENIWISYAPLRAVPHDLLNLTHVHGHRTVMEPRFNWENVKIGAGAPPVVMPHGLFFAYHAVCDHGGTRHYCAGIAILDRHDPARVLYRSPEPVLVPSETYEETGTVADVVFPTALRPHVDGKTVDMFYGAADRVIAAARLRLPRELPHLNRRQR
jgi:predicted GH43/DUF377 family glycosyl hydrolase